MLYICQHLQLGLTMREPLTTEFTLGFSNWPSTTALVTVTKGNRLQHPNNAPSLVQGN